MGTGGRGKWGIANSNVQNYSYAKLCFSCLCGGQGWEMGGGEGKQVFLDTVCNNSCVLLPPVHPGG